MKPEGSIGQLTQLGLNAYEAKAYATLLGKESFTAAQVADLSGVPRQRIYDVLASLVDRGLAISRPNRRGAKYAAVAPTQALAGLLEHQQERLDRLRTVTEELIGVLNDQYQSGKDADGRLDYIEVLRGDTAIDQRFAEILSGCREEILTLARPPYMKPLWNAADVGEPSERQISARSIYEESALFDEDLRLGIQSYLRQGEEVRFVKRLPLRVVIVDEAVAMFAMEAPIVGRTETTIMVVENRALAALLKLAFSTLWAGGETLDAACVRLDLPGGL